jgi:pimeloyl-ACP methyl ester carboxylesterase
MDAVAIWTSERLAAACAADGEFGLAARFWTGGLRFVIGERILAVTVTDGAVKAGDPGDGAPGVIQLSTDEAAWAGLTAAIPARFNNDIASLLGRGMRLQCDPVLYAQYYGAAMRAVELMRPTAAADALPVPKPAGAYDAPVGRYIHLQLGGQDHRIYFEEAGEGIPLLLQHTAGAHGAQWRHLFESEAITRHFRLIAYDLPFHGKSLPPTGPAWWATQYKLKGDFLRSVPVTLARTLGLDRPVFMGCSVGGLLALDLARHHPDVYRDVISLEWALKIVEDLASLSAFWRPDVSSDYKARLMNALMSPTSPEPYRRETMQVYASGWPPAFLGDLAYYVEEFDLTTEAHLIDTAKVAVHILSGEYDTSGTAELGRAAHEAIKGSTWAMMEGVGHFPMSENPEAFLRHLLPVLETVRAG